MTKNYYITYLLLYRNTYITYISFTNYV